MTLETDQAVWETALALGEDPEVKNLIQRCSPTDSAKELLETDRYPKARRILQKFLSEFGHRTVSRDITAPHWSDEPAQVISVIKGILREEIPESPHVRAQKSKIRMESAMEEARRRILKKWHGFLSWLFFRYIANKTRLFIGYRENQRFTLDRIIFVMRKIALEIGSRLVEMGVLEQADDVFFLEREELERLLKEQRADAKLNEKIIHRRKEHTTNKEVLPSAYIKGNFEFDEEEEGESSEEGVLCGLNASPGIVEGIARVLTDIQCAHELKNGEILVTESTDPAWSAAFMKAGGLVLETGGVLSHGAILAREFGIPAVTHVKQATQLIKTGQRIRVDGTRGRVMFLENLF
jgi:pyruvate,water dikinase